MTPTDRFILRQQEDRRLFSVLIVLFLVGVLGISLAALKVARDGYDHEQLVLEARYE